MEIIHKGKKIVLNVGDIVLINNYYYVKILKIHEDDQRVYTGYSIHADRVLDYEKRKCDHAKISYSYFESSRTIKIIKRDKITNWKKHMEE